MRHTALRTWLLLLSTILLLAWGKTTPVAAQYYQMKVRTLDGFITLFNVNQIDSMYFELVKPDSAGNNEDETTVTGDATDITNYTATITSWANILDNLSTDLEVGIFYTLQGTPSKSNGTKKTVDISSIGNDAKYEVCLTDLTPSTTYYYRSYVYQSGIWFYGNVEEFTTKGQGVTLFSGDVSKLTCYSAKINGSVNVDAATQYKTLVYGICYGTDTVPTINTNRIQANSKDNDGIFTCQLRALSGSTTYYYRAYAYMDNYLSYGPIRSFTTNADDVVTTGDIETSTCSVKSSLKIGSGAYSTLALGVCYGKNETPTVDDWIVTTNEVDDESNFELTLTSIPNGKIYYRSYVLIDDVAHYGNIKFFEYIIPVEAVDLGLSVKWASFNLGATKPEDYGDYYAWGETKTKTNYSWSTYKYCNGTSSTLTKYNNDSRYGIVDNKGVLDLEDDAAYVNWGGNWRMPTQTEINELCNGDNCTWVRTTQNGVNGFLVTSKISGHEGTSIFLPAAGDSDDSGHLYAVGTYGYYWSNSLHTGGNACGLGLSTIDASTGYRSRAFGRSIRPVCP